MPRTGVRFIPIVITDDDQAIQDTTDIIDHFEARYPEPTIYPSTPLQRLVALLLEVLTDNRNRTVAEVRHIFDKYSGSLGETGCVSWLFDKKGMVVVSACRIVGWSAARDLFAFR